MAQFGFRVNSMTMGDFSCKETLWRKEDWEDNSEEVKIEIPATILKCQAVSREMEFSTTEAIQDLKLRQHLFLHGQKIEEWNFEFGFVMPNSTNTWENIIMADPNPYPAQLLSGNITIDTSFFDGDKLIANKKLRVYYSN